MQKLCFIYSMYVSQCAPQIQHYLLLKSQNHEYQQSLFIYLFTVLQEELPVLTIFQDTIHRVVNEMLYNLIIL